MLQKRPKECQHDACCQHKARFLNKRLISEDSLFFCIFGKKSESLEMNWLHIISEAQKRVNISVFVNLRRDEPYFEILACLCFGHLASLNQTALNTSPIAYY